MLYWFGKIILTPFIFLLFRPSVRNWRGMSVKGPVIFISNHFAYADPVLLGLLCPRCIRYMAMGKFFSMPFFGRLLRSLRVFPAYSGTGSTASVKQALEILREGHAFGIFPEGHRTADGMNMDEFEKGCAFIAIKSGAPVVPVYVDPQSWKRFKIRAAVGSPIDPKPYAPLRTPLKGTELLNMRLRSEMDALKTEVDKMIRKRRPGK